MCCLPILVHAVFLALDWVLLESVGCLGTVHAVDYRLSSGSFFILPIIMGATMFIRSSERHLHRFSEGHENDPIIFTSSLVPAGLCCMVVNNVLSIYSGTSA